MKRLIKWLVILGILGGIVFFSIGPVQSYLKMRNTQNYRSSKVTKGRIESVVNSTGTVKPIQSVSIGAFVSGPIAEILVDYNSIVKKGDLLARIDPRLHNTQVERDKAALKTQEADLARIDALLQQAKNNEARARKLLAINKDYVSDTEMDQFIYTRMSMEAQRNLAEAMISQAKAALKTSETNLEYTKITSPVNGIVIERKVDPGQTMAATFQTPEMFIVAPDMERIHVYASVDEADVGRVTAAKERGEPVKFTVDAYPEEIFEGTVYQIRQSSTTTSNVVTYPVVIEAKNQLLTSASSKTPKASPNGAKSKAPNPQHKLMPGMTANISFVIEAKEDVLRVPAAALRFYPQPFQVHPDDRHYLEGMPSRDSAEVENKPSATEKVAIAKNRLKRLVWVHEGDFLRAVPVTLGLYDNQWFELIEGKIKEGQELVVGLSTSPTGK
jgi:HlyD family secretion protein